MSRRTSTLEPAAVSVCSVVTRPALVAVRLAASERVLPPATTVLPKEPVTTTWSSPVRGAKIELEIAPRLALAHPVVPPQLVVFQRLPSDAEGAEAAAACAARAGQVVGEEVGDGGDRDDVADVLRVVLVLERHADHVAVLVQRRPA